MSIQNNWGWNMSYSTLSVYKQSQLQFYYEKISKTQAPTDKVPQGYGIAGNIVHDVCEAYAKDKTMNPEDMFMTLWFEKNMQVHKQLNGKPFDIQRYHDLLLSCIRVLDFLHAGNGDIAMIPEEKLQFNEPLLDNILIKGFIDLVVNIDAGVFLYDWKTNAKPNYDMHKDQRLFYAWLYWKVHKVLPKECKWYYAEINDFKNDAFTLDQVKDFEVELYRIIREIKEKGDDITKYEVGDYDTPFNAYRTACIREKNNRKNALCFGIASWGNYSVLMGDISPLLQRGLSKKLSYEKENAHFIRKNSNWDGIVRFYDKKKNAFPTGLRPDVIKVLEDYAGYMKKNLELEFKDMTNYTGQIDVPEKLIDIELRSYQKEAVEAFLKSKYGIIKMVTGMGKTLTAAELIRRICTNTLWIIDKKILLEQTKEVFEDVLGVPIGTITEGEFKPEEITICTYQTLAKHARQHTDYLKTIGFIIIDETHKAGAKSIKAICDLCPNTSYRLGLSATPDLKKDFLEVKALVGPVCFELDKDDERNKTFLSDSKITFIDLDDMDYAEGRDYHETYQNYIVDNKMRNDKIAELVEKHKGKNILIITKLIDHAEKLSKQLGVPNLLGKTKKEDRAQITKDYHEDKGFVCIGSIQIVSEGWDIKELDVVIQAAAPASPVKTIQGLGRVLRKHDTKEQALYYDFNDRHERLFRSAARKRRYSLENEGHEINDERVKT